MKINELKCQALGLNPAQMSETVYAAAIAAIDDPADDLKVSNAIKIFNAVCAATMKEKNLNIGMAREFVSQAHPKLWEVRRRAE